MCVCSLRYRACNAHAPCFHLWPVRLCSIFPHYLINDKFSKKNIRYKTYFDVQHSCVCNRRYSVLRTAERAVGVRVKWPLVWGDVNENLIFSRDFRKLLKYQISWKSIHRSPNFSMQTDGQTDMAMLITDFRYFCKKKLLQKTRHSRHHRSHFDWTGTEPRALQREAGVWQPEPLVAPCREQSPSNATGTPDDVSPPGLRYILQPSVWMIRKVCFLEPHQSAVDGAAAAENISLFVMLTMKAGCRDWQLPAACNDVQAKWLCRYIIERAAVWSGTIQQL